MEYLFTLIFQHLKQQFLSSTTTKYFPQNILYLVFQMNKLNNHGRDKCREQYDSNASSKIPIHFSGEF